MMKFNSTKKILCTVGTVMAVGSMVSFAASCMSANGKCVKKMIRKKANQLTDIVDIVTSMI